MDTAEGRAIRHAIGAGKGESHLFRVDLEEVIESWHHQRGPSVTRRR